MPDDRQGRDKQARDEERRQREREMAEEVERGDEAPPLPDEVDDALDDYDYPLAPGDLVDDYGDVELRDRDGGRTVGDVLGLTDERFDSPDEARRRLHRLASRD